MCRCMGQLSSPTVFFLMYRVTASSLFCSSDKPASLLHESPSSGALGLWVVGWDSRDPTSSPQAWETSARPAMPSPQPFKFFLSLLRFTFYLLILSVGRKQMTAGASRGQSGWNYRVLWIVLSSTLQEHCVFLTT